MTRAIGETNRRRDKQIAFNTLHGITLVGIKKQIKYILDGINSHIRSATSTRLELRNASEAAEIAALSEKDVGKQIELLEKQML
jgi:excinuclease ABC subunit B